MKRTNYFGLIAEVIGTSRGWLYVKYPIKPWMRTYRPTKRIWDGHFYTVYA